MTLFTDTTSLEIPDFQRNYSWGEDQIDAFHKDLVFATKKKSDHFLGSTILMKSKPNDPDDKTYQVIDGQQRLTTIFMYIAIIRDLLMEFPENQRSLKPSGASGVTINVVSKANELLFSDEMAGESRFKSNALLASFFYEYIVSEPSPSRPAMPRTHKYYSLDLRKAHSRIKDQISEDLKESESHEEKVTFLWELLQTFRTRLQILRITTNSYSESFDIFMTLNNRGLALGPSDLVKSLFMKYSAQELSADKVNASNEKIARDWKDITDNIGDGDVDQFLRHYLVAKQDSTVQSKKIFTTIEEMVTKKGEDPKQVCRELLSELMRMSETYSLLLKPDRIEDSFIQKNCSTLHNLSDSYRILMMIVIDPTNDLDIQKKRELSKICEILTVRWILTGGNAQQLEDHFQKVCSDMRNKEKTFEDVKKELIRLMPLDDKCGAQFDIDTSKTALVRTVLYRINTLIGDKSELLNMDPSKVHVEHIAPATPTDYWKTSLFPEAKSDISAEYSVLVEQWGNKTLLDKKINTSIGQSDFRIKCDGLENSSFGGYKNTPISITKELDREKIWTYESVKKRNRWIKDCFLKIWTLEQDLEGVVAFHDWADTTELKNTN